MKTQIKTIAFTVSAAMIALLFFSFRPGEHPSETIMIRARQHIFKGETISFIKVYRGDTRVENIQLDKFSLDNEDKNYDKLISTIRTYEKQGYQVISHNEILLVNDGFINTFILTKK